VRGGASCNGVVEGLKKFAKAEKSLKKKKKGGAPTEKKVKGKQNNRKKWGKQTENGGQRGVLMKGGGKGRLVTSDYEIMGKARVEKSERLVGTNKNGGNFHHSTRP